MTHLISHGRYKGEGYPIVPRSSGSGAPLTSYAGPAAAIIYPPGYADLLCTDVLGGTVPLAPFISTPTDTTTTAPAQVVVREIPADRVLVLPNNAIAP